MQGNKKEKEQRIAIEENLRELEQRKIKNKRKQIKEKEEQKRREEKIKDIVFGLERRQNFRNSITMIIYIGFFVATCLQTIRIAKIGQHFVLQNQLTKTMLGTTNEELPLYFERSDKVEQVFLSIARATD